jgi:hypothetical protein
VNPITIIQNLLSSLTPGTKKTLIIGAVVAFVAVCGVVMYAMYTGNMDSLIEFRKAAK